MQGSENPHTVAAADQISHAAPAKRLQDRRYMVTAPRPRNDSGSKVEDFLNTAQAASSGPAPD